MAEDDREFCVSGFVRVRQEDGSLSFGGSQDWYEDRWMRLAGCASVAAANLAAFYRIGVSPDAFSHDAQLYGREKYLELMRHMFSIMKPGIMGFPYADRFRSRFIDYAAGYGVKLSSEVIFEWDDAGQPLNFVKKSLQANDPPAMMVLRHQAPEIDELTWHWMVITAYSGKTNQITVSSFGREESADAGLLFQPARGNEVKLISFHNCRRN